MVLSPLSNVGVSDHQSGHRSLLQRIETSTLQTAGGTDFNGEIFESAIRHLRALGAEDTLTILDSVQAAIDEAEQRTNRTLRESVTRTIYYRGFSYLTNLPLPPLQSITSVKYYDSDSVLQTITASDYTVLASTRGAGDIVFDSDYTFPNVDTDRLDIVQVVAVTGWGSAAAIPPLCKAGIRLLAEAHYDGSPMARDEAFRVLQPYVYRGLS